MNQICIAKKVSHNNVEFLDFALDDDGGLIIFSSFKEASEFLKAQVGNGPELLDYIITTTEAQAGNTRLQAILELNASTQPKIEAPLAPAMPSITTEDEVDKTKEEVQFMFIMDCDQFEILNNDSIFDKINNRHLAPVIAFVDVANPVAPVPMPNFQLKTVFVEKAATE